MKTKNVWSVARRELRSFLDHPTAYILVVAFLSLALFLTFRDVYASGAASLRPFFSVLPWLFAVFIPALTMRSLAEERRSHTLEWLLAQPLNEAEVMVGKFLGNWLLGLLALAGTVPTALGILLISEADPGIMVAQYTGAALLTAQFVGVGLWASSATRNQVTAFILGIAVSFGFVLMGTQIVLIGLPPVLAGAVASLSVLGHFDNVARGVIDLRDVLYFLSVGGVFLVLGWAVVTRRRLAPGRGSFRRVHLGAGLAVASVLVLNLLSSHIRGRLDLTRDNLYTLSQGTRQILGELDDLVTVKLVVSQELPSEIQLTERDVRDLLADLRRASNGQIRIDELNPDDDEDAATEASSLGIRPIQFNVLRGDEFQAKRGWFGLAVLYAGEQEVIPVVSRTDDLEYRLTSAVAKMTAEGERVLGVLSGFGAKTVDQSPGLRELLEDRFTLKTVSLSDTVPPTLSPDSLDVVLLAGPTEPLNPPVIRAIESYIDAGGAALLMVDRNQLDPRSPVARSIHTGLESVLSERGVEVQDGMLYDLRSNEQVSLGRQGPFQMVRSYPFWPVAFTAGEHAVIRDLENLIVAWANPLTVTDSARVTPLWQTTEAAGVRPPGGTILPDEGAFQAVTEEELGVRTVAVAVDLSRPAGQPSASSGSSEPSERSEDDPDADNGPEPAPGGGRMIVVGDSDFLAGQFTRNNPQNQLFVANAVDWLAQDEALIDIRSKDRTPPALVFESELEKNVLKWGNLVGLPLLLALVGFVRVAGRRRRAERKWKDVEWQEVDA